MNNTRAFYLLQAIVAAIGVAPYNPITDRREVRPPSTAAQRRNWRVSYEPPLPKCKAARKGIPGVPRGHGDIRSVSYGHRHN